MLNFTWNKLGKVFDPSTMSNKAFIQLYAQAPSVIVHEKFVRVYFSCRPLPDANGQFVSYSAYIDLDRNDLLKIIQIAERPILSLGERGTFDEFGTYPVSVIANNEEYWCYYAGWTRCESVPFNVAIGLAVSDDGGKTFIKKGNGPILSYSPNEPFILSGPKIRKFNNEWYLFYIAGDKWIIDNDRPEPIYTIRMATSTDGLHWNKLDRRIISPKEEGQDEAQASPDVFFKDGLYHMFFCYRACKDYRINKERSYKIGYAYSYNLIDWIRSDDKAGIHVSETGWDSQSMSYPHVFELDGELYMLYLGNEVGKYGFGLAVLNQ